MGDRSTGEGLNEPGRRDQLPISLPLDGGGREAFSMAGQPDPLARTGIHHPRLSPVQTQPTKNVCIAQGPWLLLFPITQSSTFRVRTPALVKNWGEGPGAGHHLD